MNKYKDDAYIAHIGRMFEENDVVMTVTKLKDTKSDPNVLTSAVVDGVELDNLPKYWIALHALVELAIAIIREYDDFDGDRYPDKLGGMVTDAIKEGIHDR
jgi:hypothetical protein